MVVDACTSENPLLMDRRVLLATSVLESALSETGGSAAEHQLLLSKLVLEFHHPKSVWHMREIPGFASLASNLRHDTVDDAAERRFLRHVDGTDDADNIFGLATRRGGGRRPNPGGVVSSSGVVMLDASDDANGLSSHAVPDLPEGEAMRRATPAGSGLSLSPSAVQRVRKKSSVGFSGSRFIAAAIRASRKDTVVGKVSQACLKFFGVLDRHGERHARRRRRRKLAEDSLRFNGDPKTWIERPESHTQYASGKVMFRSEVSRLMATVFYTPGLMELVDSLTRDATLDEDIGHHVRIWSVPLAEELYGKLMGDAFQKYAKEEALVIGIYREGTEPKTAAGVHSRGDGSGGGTASRENRPLGESSDSESSTDGGEESDPEGDAKCRHRYVLTSPLASAALNRSDRLYVIATTDWAWVNIPELIELRKVSAVICLQRRFRMWFDQKRETERRRRLSGSAPRRQRVEQHAVDGSKLAPLPLPKSPTML